MKKPKRSQRDKLRKMPDPLRHRQSRAGIENVWRKMTKTIYSPRVLGDLPPFASKVARAFWDADASKVVDAVLNGDPAFFIAFQLRLDQIDCALLAAGHGLASRAPVVRSKWILDGFKQAAIEELERNGGTWPPEPTAAEPA
jgi:hypothetical protein